MEELGRSGLGAGMAWSAGGRLTRAVGWMGSVQGRELVCGWRRACSCDVFWRLIETCPGRAVLSVSFPDGGGRFLLHPWHARTLRDM